MPQDSLTPAMKQYVAAKEQYPDCVIMFRMGDFYEMFFEDAKIAAKELEIVLTKRGKAHGQDIPLAGIPYHALDSYLAKLIRRGYKVAICEQMEDPKKAKGVVKRDIVRIVTPGTLVEDSLLSQGESNYVLSLVFEGKVYGIAYADISTGEFKTTKLSSKEKLFGELKRLNPREVLLGFDDTEVTGFLSQHEMLYHIYSGQYSIYEFAKQLLATHFGVKSLEGFGIEGEKTCVAACGIVLHYLKDTQKNSLSYIHKIQRYFTESFMVLDPTTIRNLELVKNMKDGTQKGTLLEAIDKTKTPMGGRLIRQWLLWPLMQKQAIEERQDAVLELSEKSLFREELAELLENTYDLERCLARISYGTASPRDVLALKKTLEQIPLIKEIAAKCSASLLFEMASLEDHSAVVTQIERAIKDEPSASVKDGDVIRKGYNLELDELRELSTGGKTWISAMEQKEREKTGIKSLKIRFNRVFGYFIEVTKPNLPMVPADYIRKQTQVNAERFITQELKEKENLILGAEEKILELEAALFSEVCQTIAHQAESMQDIAKTIAALDVLVSFSTIALQHRYVRPQIADSYGITIVEGRHPVIELGRMRFIANDCILSENERMHIITGPNMAGKSTFMRQVACIVLLAHTGCFVPATKAVIGITDRVFTRVGASDDLGAGQSTFMVEMHETANILNNATQKSLIILDEIGRGTSTFDGISLAWSVARYITENIKAKTLFATHYHILNKLVEHVQGVKNYNISVLEKEDQIVFLHKIVEGGTDKSYGIHVAKIAGLPKEVITEAKALQATLEEEDKMISSLEAKYQPVMQEKKSAGMKSVVKKSRRVSLKDDIKQMKLFDVQA